MERCFTNPFLHLKQRYKRKIKTRIAKMTKSPSPAAGEPFIVKMWNPDDSTWFWIAFWISTLLATWACKA